MITVDCSQGEKGNVYDKALKFKVNTINVKEVTKSKTKIMLNVGHPDEAFSLGLLPSDGVGLVREEFIVTESFAFIPWPC